MNRLPVAAIPSQSEEMCCLLSSLGPSHSNPKWATFLSGTTCWAIPRQLLVEQIPYRFFLAAIRTVICNRQLLELSVTYNSITTVWSRSCLTKMTVFRSIRIVILAMLLCKRTNRIHESASLITYCSDERDSSKTQMKAEVNFPHFFVKNRISYWFTHIKSMGEAGAPRVPYESSWRRENSQSGG